MTEATLGARITTCATMLSAGGICDGSELTGAQIIAGLNIVTQSHIRVILPQAVTVTEGGQLALNGVDSTLEGSPAGTTVDASQGTSAVSVFVSTARGFKTAGTIHIIGNRTAGGTASAVDVQGTVLLTNIELTGLQIVNAGAHAIVVKQVSANIHDNVITTSRNSGIRCVTQCADTTISGNLITGDASGAVGDAAIAFACSGAPPCPSNIKIYNNTITNAGVVGIPIGRAGANAPTNILISGNTILGAGQAGLDGECITFEGINGSIFSNYINGCYGHGIQLLGSVTNTTIHDNEIGNISTNPNDNGAAAIMLTLGIPGACFAQDGIKIHSNRIHDNGTPTTPFPLRVYDACDQSAGTVTNVQVWDNFSDNALAPSVCSPGDCTNPEVDFAPLQAVQQGAYHYCVDTASGTDAYVCTLKPTLLTTNLAAGTMIILKPATNNTGGATLTINRVATKTITRGDGTTLATNTLRAGQDYILIYSGSLFRLQAPAP